MAKIKMSALADRAIPQPPDGRRERRRDGYISGFEDILREPRPLTFGHLASVSDDLRWMAGGYRPGPRGAARPFWDEPYWPPTLADVRWDSPAPEDIGRAFVAAGFCVVLGTEVGDPEAGETWLRRAIDPARAWCCRRVDALLRRVADPSELVATFGLLREDAPGRAAAAVVLERRLELWVAVGLFEALTIPGDPAVGPLLLALAETDSLLESGPLAEDIEYVRKSKRFNNLRARMAEPYFRKLPPWLLAY